MRYLNDITIGEHIVFPGRYAVTAENIIEMGKEWDPYPFHTDVDAAKETLYGGLVASTVHLFAISVKLGHTATDVMAAVASLGITELTNHAPAYAGDTLQCECTYLEKRDSKSRPGLGIMTARSQLLDQNGKLIFSYLTTALYKMNAE